MRHPLVAIDIDGTLSNTPLGFTRLIERTLHRHYPLETSRSYFFEELLCRDQEALDLLARTLRNPGFYRDLEPLESALDGVWALAERYDCFYWTARPTEATQATYAWLSDQRFPPLWVATVESGKIRAHFGQAAGVTDAIDDSAANARSLAEVGIATTVIPWNHNLDSEALRLDWAEIALRVRRGGIREVVRG